MQEVGWLNVEITLVKDLQMFFFKLCIIKPMKALDHQNKEMQE